MHGKGDNSTERKDGQITTRDFTAQDMMDVIAKGVIECGIRAEATDEIWELSKAREAVGLAYTGTVNGEVVGCAGLDLFWPGVGEVWLLLCETSMPIRTITVLKEGLKELIKENNLHRIQCHIRHDLPKGVKLVEHLGFEFEGIAKKFTHDKMDCFMYSITR